ncbi:MAG: 3-methyl-2-oxobutanoate hydroxymethyltransferase [Myxococcales bacterium]|nr:3-methyl-2-oxobutanoate hydroxymethyltransferase [Myxococcales bacterium]
MARKQFDLNSLRKRKRDGEKITMLTAYDCPTARLVDEAGVDVVLVGDSAANVVLGYDDTVPVTMDELLVLCRAVRRGVKHAMLVGDMPFGSYQVCPEDAIRNGMRFMKEAGCDAVKLEGGGRMIDTIRAMVEAGVPVVGHLGLTPQTASLVGGYRVQGRTAESAKKMIEEAIRIAAAGAWMLVLELVPDRVAGEVAKAIDIPVIGIGAGPEVDGQVLVLHDMLGVNEGFAPKFLKKYAALGPTIREAAKEYIDDVKMKRFPGPEHSFGIEDGELAKLYGGS